MEVLRSLRSFALLKIQKPLAGFSLLNGWGRDILYGVTNQTKEELDQFLFLSKFNSTYLGKIQQLTLLDHMYEARNA